MKELDKVLFGPSVGLDHLIKSIQVQSDGDQAASFRKKRPKPSQILRKIPNFQFVSTN